MYGLPGVEVGPGVGVDSEPASGSPEMVADPAAGGIGAAHVPPKLTMPTPVATPVVESPAYV
jgi:hypothetical protein